ncbi:MAG: GNAT family N-acetyltransferase [Vicinamibacterales bacterium]
MSAGGFDVECVAGDGLWSRPEMVDRWRALVDADLAHGVFHQPDVIRAWMDTVGVAIGAEPSIYFARSGGQAVAALATVVVRQRGRLFDRRVLEPVGRELFGYHDALVAGPRDRFPWPAFWSALRAASAGTVDQALFRFVARGEGWTETDVTERAPVLELSGLPGVDAVLGRCSANHRGDTRRRTRRLDQRGARRLRIFEPAAADEALEVFRSRLWPSLVARYEHQGYRMHEAPGVEAFARRLAREGVREGWAHLAALEVDGAPIAWHLGLVHRGELYWWLPAHDAAWEPYSPGKVLLHDLVDWMCRAGWRRLHFQTGAQAYKTAWTPVAREFSAVRWFAPSMKGNLLSRYGRVVGT